MFLYVHQYLTPVIPHILPFAKKYGQTIVMITHDDEIAQVADRILVIEDGQVVDFN